MIYMIILFLINMIHIEYGKHCTGEVGNKSHKKYTTYTPPPPPPT